MPYRRSRLISVPAEPAWPDAISVSHLGELATCPLRYQFTRIQGWRWPEPSPRREFGRLVHAILASLFRLPAQRRTRPAVAELAYRTARQVQSDRPVRSVAQALETRALALWDLLDPGAVVVAPGGVERRLTGQIGGLSVRGRADLVFHASGTVTIADFKTGDAGPQPDPGELYPDVRSRSAHGLPVLPLASDDPFFALRTYATLLPPALTSAPHEVGLELLYLSPPKRDSSSSSAEGRGRHLVVLTRLVDDLRTGINHGAWQARHGPHCRDCPFRRVCPLLTSDGTALDEGYATVLRRAGLQQHS